MATSAAPDRAESVPPASSAASPVADVEAHGADFAPLTHPVGPLPGLGTMDRLLDVSVTVTAELGRVTLSISDVLKLGIGSVLELDRAVSEPVDLMVQGVRLARGEVVVVDDRFAIRIKEIADPRKRAEK